MVNDLTIFQVRKTIVLKYLCERSHVMVFDPVEFFCSCCGKRKSVKVVVCSDCKAKSKGAAHMDTHDEHCPIRCRHGKAA